MEKLVVALLLMLTAGPLAGQDTCASPVALPSSGWVVGTTDGLTASGMPLSCTPFAIAADWWGSFQSACAGTYRVSFCEPGASAAFNPVIAIYGGPCASPVELACVDNTCGLLPEATVSLAPGQPVRVRVMDALFSTGAFQFRVEFTPTITLVWSQPLGPGSLQFDQTCGNPGNMFLMAVSFDSANGGPGLGTGWWGGLHISWLDILTEWNFGPPFRGTLDGLGQHTFLFPGGMPPGLPTLYSVTHAFEAGTGVLTGISNLVGFVVL